MIAFISLIYASFYFLVFGKGIVKKSARNMSIFVGVGDKFDFTQGRCVQTDGCVFACLIPVEFP